MDEARRIPARQAIRYRTDAALFLGFRRLTRALPLDAASALGEWTGRRVCPALVDMSTVRKNIEAGLPSLTEAQRRSLAVDHLGCFGRTLAEIMQAESFIREPGRVGLSGAEHLERALASGRGVIYASAHYGNPDLARLAVGSRSQTPALVYRPPNNPHIRRAAAAITSAVGGELYLRGETDLRKLLRHLKGGGGLSLLVDQRPYQGARLPLLDRPVLTATGPASLALRTGSIMLPVRAKRVSKRPVEFDVRFERPIERGDEESMMAEMNDHLSVWIREEPAQWLWMHRRWR